MDIELIERLNKKRIFIELDENLLKKALFFYKAGIQPKNISSAQLSAVSMKIYRASSTDEAKKQVVAFLSKQMEKLSKKQKDGEQKSWLKKPEISCETETLGDMVKDWIKNEEYLLNEHSASGLDRLSIMRRFWGFVSGLYNYKKSFEKGMPIEEGEL